MATAYKFIPAPSAWFSPALEEIAANIEIQRDRLIRQYQNREMPLPVEERLAALDKAWDSNRDTDAFLRDAESV